MVEADARCVAVLRGMLDSGSMAPVLFFAHVYEVYEDSFSDYSWSLPTTLAISPKSLRELARHP
jgi:hypothetical protein